MDQKNTLVLVLIAVIVAAVGGQAPIKPPFPNATTPVASPANTTIAPVTTAALSPAKTPVVSPVAEPVGSPPAPAPSKKVGRKKHIAPAPTPVVTVGSTAPSVAPGAITDAPSPGPSEEDDATADQNNRAEKMKNVHMMVGSLALGLAVFCCF